MKTFDYVNAKSLAEAASLLPKHEGDESTRLMAGGQDLLTELKEHLVEPDRVVNLKQIEGLDQIEWTGDGLVIGALARLEELAAHPRVQKEMTLLSEAAESIASPQIRSQATIGGNLNQRPRCWYYRNEDAPCLKKGGFECFAYEGRNKYNAILGGGPSYIVHPSDLAPALIALDATVELFGPDGERSMKLADFFTLPADGNILRETVLAPNEILTRVIVPAPKAGLKSTYLKFRERSSYDFALSAVAICLWGGSDKIEDLKGLGWRHPVVAIAMVVFLVSLTGLPPTVGFYGKYLLFVEGVDAGLGWLIFIAALNSVVSLFYYFKVAKALFLKEPAVDTGRRGSSVLAALIVALSIGTVLFFMANKKLAEWSDEVPASLNISMQSSGE